MLSTVFTGLSAIAAANAAIMIVLRDRGYGTPWLIAEAAAVSMATLACARAARDGDRAALARAVVVWSGAVVAMVATLGATYEPGPRFWAYSAAAMASWGVVGLVTWRHVASHPVVFSGRALPVEPAELQLGEGAAPHFAVPDIDRTPMSAAHGDEAHGDLAHGDLAHGDAPWPERTTPSAR